MKHDTPTDFGPPKQKRRIHLRHIAFFTLITLAVLHFNFLSSSNHSTPSISKAQQESLLAQCKALRTPAGPPPSYSPSSRKESERYVPGTPAYLIQNAKIWTGTKEGKEMFHGSLLLDKGVISAVRDSSLHGNHWDDLYTRRDLKVIDARGKWVTPGIVDLHSHLGVYSAPELQGASDGNSFKAPILPWLRSIDGLNTHDDAYALSVAGGVTTAQILPGSADNIGGQAYLMKLRHTEERTTTSMILEPPIQLHAENITGHKYDYVPWRHMKHACGENPSATYSQTRMDSAWNFRAAYNEARKILESQDSFCSKVEQGNWEALSDEQLKEGVPASLKWESLVDVLRGRVRLAVHCYEAVDLDLIVRLSNEFKFPVASFHHAGETYLVPDLLKKTWGGAPSIALFANNFRKKREAYRGSEFAPRILAENGIPVVMKSDHPVLNSRYLLYEAQQAFFYGLDPGLALSSVTSTPARAAGVGHRVGSIAVGYDADIVIWDSHPLALGATPAQVFIDGIPQLADPIIVEKPETFQHLPKVPNFDREARETVEWEGLPPLRGAKRKLGKSQAVRFVNVGSMFLRDGDIVQMPPEALASATPSGEGVVVVSNGIICMGECAASYDDEEGVMEIDLEGGSISPALMTYGSPIGLVEIRLEASTNDGDVRDPLGRDVPGIMGEEFVVRAVDGLQFGGRNTLLAYKDGVTKAITAPTGSGFLRGVSTMFRTGAMSAAEDGAVLMEETALHVSVRNGLKASVSTQVAALRSLLNAEHGSESAWSKVQQGIIPLVVDVDSADIMATLIDLKREYESTGKTLKMTFSGAAESHLIAKHIKQANVSVILTSPRPYPGEWSQRRIIPGPPLTQLTSITALFNEGVNVAIGVQNEATARNTRFDIAWASLEANGTLSKKDAFALVTTNLEKALGVSYDPRTHWHHDLVAYKGGDAFGFESRAVAVIGGGGGVSVF